MIKIYISYFILIVGFSLCSSAQINMVIEDITDKEVYLTQTISGKNYILDTIKVDNANIVIEEFQLNENEFYGITIPSLRYEHLDFFYEGFPFKIYANVDELLASLRIEKSSSNEALYEDLQLNLPLLTSLLELHESKARAIASKYKIKSLLEQVRQNRSQLLAKHANTLWAKMYRHDEGAQMPYFSNKRFRKLVDKYKEFDGDKTAFISNIYTKNTLLTTSKIFERRIDWILNHQDFYHNDSLIHFMDTLYAVTSQNSDLYHYALMQTYHRFNTMQDHEIEEAMIYFWDSYFKNEKVPEISVLAKWKFGKLIYIRANTLIGELAPAFDVRDENFKKLKLDEVDAERKY